MGHEVERRDLEAVKGRLSAATRRAAVEWGASANIARGPFERGREDAEAVSATARPSCAVRMTGSNESTIRRAASRYQFRCAYELEFAVEALEDAVATAPGATRWLAS